MTTQAGAVEHRVTAFLEGEDSPHIMNPIHSTQVAREYGYPAALVGGVTVWGWATPAVLEALGESWLDHGWAEVYFRRPTYPGDELTIRVEPGEGAAPGARRFGMTKADGTEAVGGLLGLGEAPWFAELHSPADREPQPRPDVLPPLTMENAPVGRDLPAMAVPAPVEEMIEYAVGTARSSEPRFTVVCDDPDGGRPLVHPGWLAGRMTRLMRHSYDVGVAIHASSQIQNLGRVVSGQTLTVAGRFVETFERRGHQYAIVDGLIAGEDGRELVRIRHTTIFEVAKRASGETSS